MVRAFHCANCGDHGWVLSDEPTVAFCLRCGHRLEYESAGPEWSPFDGPAIDDAVAFWMSQPPIEPVPETHAVASCASCGWEGLMPYDSARGDTICPACLAVYRTRPEPAQQLINCPNCQEPIQMHENDRGKTIVCPACNYFLGCVLLPEKRRFNALPFLNVLLGTAKD